MSGGRKGSDDLEPGVWTRGGAQEDCDPEPGDWLSPSRSGRRSGLVMTAAHHFPEGMNMKDRDTQEPTGSQVSSTPPPVPTQTPTP